MSIRLGLKGGGRGGRCVRGGATRECAESDWSNLPPSGVIRSDRNLYGEGLGIGRRVMAANESRPIRFQVERAMELDRAISTDLGDSRRIWMVLDGFGRLSMALDGSRWLWMALDGSGAISAALKGSQSHLSSSPD